MAHKMNNVKDSIGWADYTWNPITGCKRGCSYCYARRIHERFNKTPFSEIVYHPSRIKELEWLDKQESSTVFVGSMSDIEYWPIDAAQHILDEIQYHPKHTFMFLSKNPTTYYTLYFPPNTMQGLTLEKCETVEECDKVALLIYYSERPFVSLEPLLGKVSSVADWQGVEKVIVGAMTGPGAIVPKQEWVDSVRANIPEEKIYWKKNILKYGLNVKAAE
jgi:protein gp37